VTARPAGADNFLRWRRTIDEHLELRRLTWDEYAMFNWLCTKASPRTGTVRTSWPVLAEQTGLSANFVGKLCASLKRKRYVWYPPHPGRRGRLVEVAIHKFPVTADTYTDLSGRFGEVPAEVLAEVPAEVPAEVAREPPTNSRTSAAGRRRGRGRDRERRLASRVRRAPPRRPRDEPQAVRPAYPAGVTELT
jgi:hypothetical protein